MRPERFRTDAANYPSKSGIPTQLSLPPRSGLALRFRMTKTHRTMIAALQVSLDGFTQGPNGEKDWVESWADAVELIPDVDTFVLGAGMYPGYGEYWKAIYANPEAVLPFDDRIPSEPEVAYARLAAKTPHIVLSTTLESVSWPTAQIVRNVADIRSL